MAKIVYAAALGEHGQLENIYDISQLSLQSSTSTQVDLADNTGDLISFEGTALQSDGTALTAGQVAEFRFISASADTLINVTGSWAANDLSDALLDRGIRGLLSTAYAGNDRFIGSENGDIIYGGTGRDRLAGRQGEDWFLFGHGDGKDVVTDFDAKGGEGKQDFIRQFSDDFTIRKSGDDTVIDFGDGDTLTLLDVKRSLVSSEDFKLFDL